jgi:hypothetical protein
MAKCIDLDGKAKIPPLLFAKFNNPIEQGLPILVAGKIVVCDEEGVDALRDVCTDYGFDVIRAPSSRLAALQASEFEGRPPRHHRMT